MKNGVKHPGGMLFTKMILPTKEDTEAFDLVGSIRHRLLECDGASSREKKENNMGWVLDKDETEG